MELIIFIYSGRQFQGVSFGKYIVKNRWHWTGKNVKTRINSFTLDHPILF